MKKSSLMSVILGSIGGLLLSIGMVLCLVEGYNLIAGIIIGAVGLIILALIYPIYCKMENIKHEFKKPSKATVVSIIIGILALIMFGAGMCLVLLKSSVWFIVGIAVGSVGIFGMIMSYPIYSTINGKQVK